MKAKIIKLAALVISVMVVVAVLWGLWFGPKWLANTNVEKSKSAVSKVWEAAGYKIVGCEGYQIAPSQGSSVWYIVRRIGDNSITYRGALTKWGDEYHIYNLRAIDALKP
jgi:hypothetical protein